MDESEPLRFESSLAQLQEIVSRLEGGSLGLEESLAEFERGVKLLRTCYRTLEEAEQKIELLVGFNEQGEAVTEPFDAKATYDEKGPSVGRRRSVKKPSPPPSEDSSAGLF
jgi:exodeoxyribonuclease VII small subunit